MNHNNKGAADLVYVGWKKLHPAAKVPVYSSIEAAGADLISVDEVTIEPGKWLLVSTGLAVELDPGFELQVRPRSGLALKKGVTVLNAPGTIDSDYRGAVGVILINHSDVPFDVKPGDRIAQIVLQRVFRAKFVATGGVLSPTERGEGGFGSTGV